MKPTQFSQVDGLRVEIDDIVYMPSLQSPPNKPHPYVYFLTIHNDSEQEVQILGRKWIVEEIEHDLVIVEGDGVVGEKPMLPPGEKFSYNSYHVIARTAEVNGAFYGILTETSTPISVDIPHFTLQTPYTK